MIERDSFLKTCTKPWFANKPAAMSVDQFNRTWAVLCGSSNVGAFSKDEWIEAAQGAGLDND